MGYIREIPKQSSRMVAMGLIIAKRRLAMRWMKGPLPTIREWHSDMLYCNIQSDNYRELIPEQSAPRDFRDPYREYLLYRKEVSPTDS